LRCYFIGYRGKSVTEILDKNECSAFDTDPHIGLIFAAKDISIDNYIVSLYY